MRPFRFLILVFALTLGACLPLHKSAAPALYQLRVPASGLMAQPPAMPVGTTLEIALPSVPAGLDKDRIALALDGGRRLDYYAAARWPEPLPNVLQDVVAASMRQTLPSLSVDDDEHQPAATHRLRVDVLNFAPVYAHDAGTLPEVRVTLRFVLIRLGDSVILTDFTLGAIEKPAANTLGAVTAALEAGLHRTFQGAVPRLAASLAPSSKKR